MTPGSGRPNRPVMLVLVSSDTSVEDALGSAAPKLPGEIQVQSVATAEEALEVMPSAGEGERFRIVPVLLLDVDSCPDACEELLHTMKSEPAYRRIPALALARNPEDTEAASLYTAHANAVVRRPDGADAFSERLVQLLDFWLTVPALP